MSLRGSKTIVAISFLFVFFFTPTIIHATIKTPIESNLGSFRDTITIQSGKMSVGAPEYTSLIADAIGDIKKNLGGNGADMSLGITSHHLPTAASFIGEFYRELWN